MTWNPSHSAGNVSDLEYTITDLIPLDRLQNIQDAFSTANQVASTITDLDGVPITRPSSHCGVCAMVRATPMGLENCMSSGKFLGELAREQQRSVQMKCLSVGFADAAAPIIINGRHIANWVIGQCHTLEVDEQRIREYSQEIGADTEQLLREFRAMPKQSREDFDRKLQFLEIMGRELSLMGYLHLQQKEQTTELLAIKAELEEHRTQLEKKVAERTLALEESHRQLQKEISEKSKIERRQNRLTTAVDGAGEAVVITSARGRIIYVNPAFEKLTGYSRREATGRNPRILKSGYHDKDFYRRLWQTIAAGGTWSGTFINRKKDGTIYQEESTISPVIDSEGKIVSYVEVKRDVTRERQLQAQLKEAQRLETIGTLAAGISHELNTPIQYILANTHFLKEAFNDLTALQEQCRLLVDAAAPAFPAQTSAITSLARDIDLESLMQEAEKALDQSLDGLDRMSRIVKTMKEFADPGGGSRELTDLNALIRSTAEVSSNVWRNVAEMQLALADGLPPVPIFVGKVKQILLDMLINAAHALAERFSQNPQQQGQIRITTQLQGREVELRVADTGVGIPEHLLSRIFDPFFSTKPVGMGEGQSLAIAHRVIVQGHGGSIRVESMPGEGTTFIILLPIEARD